MRLGTEAQLPLTKVLFEPGFFAWTNLKTKMNCRRISLPGKTLLNFQKNFRKKLSFFLVYAILLPFAV